MNDEGSQWIQQAVDGDLPPADRAALNSLLRSDPDAMAAFCGQLHMDALLAWRAGTVAPSASAAPLMAETPVRRLVPSWARWAAAVLAIAGAAILTLSPGRSSAAVHRMLMAMEQGDRSYAITVTAGDAIMPMNNGQTLTYEGAMLHVRGSREFVLVRPLIGGGQRVTGSNGMLNWDLTGNGPVKVSHHSQRFRGGIPGEQNDTPFLSIAGLLANLGEHYDTSLRSLPGQPARLCLTANRRSRDVRGPRTMSITFQRDAGTITTMELDGLPRAKGGPQSVRLTLTSESALPPDFFHHSRHHEPSRRVVELPPPLSHP